MSIEAKVVRDSVSPGGKRITTFLLQYPRFVHAEFMTHRIISKNASSSRAIPVKKMIDDVFNDPAMPEFYGAAQKGMQASVEMDAKDICEFQADIDMLKVCNIQVAKKWKDKCHKQILNRYLEPWSHITVLATATEWGNFFNLRAHTDAQPEIAILAMRMLEAYIPSVPQQVPVFGWHLPFSDSHLPAGWDTLSIGDKLKVCTARAARTSYLNFEGDVDVAKDVALHDSLKESGHWSPFEHCAQALEKPNQQSGNFIGWGQYRKTFPGEHKRKFDPVKLLEEMKKKYGGIHDLFARLNAEEIVVQEA